jgi:hypothetical protein
VSIPARRLAPTVAVALLAALATAAPAAASHAGTANPCASPERVAALRLVCPDLRMRPPFDIYMQRANGRKRLRSGNSIDSMGPGPAELRGRRTGARTMDANQRVKVRGGGRRSFDTGAQLRFKHIPGQGGYWKFRNAARFELWRLDAQGNRTRRVRTGRKQVYCLRDLQHTHPDAQGSPSRPVYPACNQNPGKRRVTLGTSSGWSDVYPASYHEQWIEVSDVGRRGCYAYVHVADRGDHIHERRENNNEASTVVRLAANGNFLGICDRRDRGVSAAQQGDGAPPAGLDPYVDPDTGEHEYPEPPSEGY